MLTWPAWMTFLGAVGTVPPRSIEQMIRKINVSGRDSRRFGGNDVQLLRVLRPLC